MENLTLPELGQKGQSYLKFTTSFTTFFNLLLPRMRWKTVWHLDDVTLIGDACIQGKC